MTGRATSHDRILDRPGGGIRIPSAVLYLEHGLRWRCAMRTLAFCLCGLACGSLLATAQQMSRDDISRAPVYRSVAKHERRANAQTTPTAPPVRAKIDLAQVRHEAEELARLAQSVPAGIGQAERGVLPKDLSQNLKKIQKLSKRLRSELSL
jgi:hypothetical protein